MDQQPFNKGNDLSSKSEVTETQLEFSNERPPDYPPQPYHDQAVSRTVEVERDNLAGTRYRVMDGSSQLYTANMKLRKPQMTIETSERIGSVVYHSHTSKIDLTLRGDSVTLRSHGMMWNRWTYESPAFRGTVTWRRKSKATKMFDFVCLLDEVPIAQFTVNNFGVTKIGKINFFGAGASSGLAMDEIVTTGLALADFLLVHVAVPGLALVSSSLPGRDK